jgi:hypothetical protein
MALIRCRSQLRTTLTAGVSALGLTLAALPALAQDNPTENPDQAATNPADSNEIIVTAQFRAQRLRTRRWRSPRSTLK